MTRINTNVSSLTAQKSLAKANSQLSESLTRLSTGLRINSGKDDPAGLIASETLRANITSIESAISNTERANQMIATADSALGQVSSLLNDIRGLVTEAANTGAMSAEQIAANQLQVDSSLEAINRIALTTSFQGQKLIDGSLDFISTASAVASVVDIQIDQANLGATGQIDVDVDISQAAAKAEITTDGFSPSTKASATLSFAAGATLAGGDSTAEVSITATGLGTTYDGVTVVVAVDDFSDTQHATAAFESGTLTITVDDGQGATSQQVVDAINGLAEFSAVAANSTDWTAADATSTVTMGIATITLEADNPGPEFNNMKVRIVADADTAYDAPTASYDATANEIVILVSDGTNDSGLTALSDIGQAIDDITEADFTVTEINTSDDDARDTISGSSVDVSATANTELSGGATLLDDLVVEIRGNKGSEVFNFQSGAGVNQIAAAINLVADAIGVEASYSGNTLTLNSTGYGSRSYVDVSVITEGTSGTFKSALSDTRAAGTDVQATVNGITADSDGNRLSINTSTLDLTIQVVAGSSDNFDFSITGGGALFQVGPEVVSNQQARLGIASMNTARLGGASGRLYQLGTGEAAALSTDPTTAGEIVDQVITKVVELRGRLGAFQRTTLETNINALNDTMESLAAAESAIRDADFAVETAALTRAQILVQSGTSVLSIANSQPQNVLALLR